MSYAWDHDYSVKTVTPEELTAIQRHERESSRRKWDPDKEPEVNVGGGGGGADGDAFAKCFSKCDKCRRSRTKVLLPESMLSVARGKNDGLTCDFCGLVRTLDLQ
jgi:hypothetical protein